MKITRLFREAVKAGNNATAVRVRKGEMEILADWTREDGWYWLGAVEDVMSDLESGDEGNRIRNAFTPEAMAFRAARDCPEPTPAVRKPTQKMTAEEQADFDTYWNRVQADRRRDEQANRERIAAEIAAAQAAIDARKNPTPKPAPEPKKRSGYSFPF